MADDPQNFIPTDQNRDSLSLVSRRFGIHEERFDLLVPLHPKWLKPIPIPPIPQLQGKLDEVKIKDGLKFAIK
jgi:hypothetical protein